MTNLPLIEQLEKAAQHLFGCTMNETTDVQKYHALSFILKNRMGEIYRSCRRNSEKQSKKQIYYLSLEFLMGPSLQNTLYQLNLVTEAEEALQHYGSSLARISSTEPDPGLGNGGLGRLAACYLDAASNQGISFTGFSIKYEFGIFKQKIVDGWQIELPDEWLEHGGVWLQPRHEDSIEIRYGGVCEGFFGDNGYEVKMRDFESVIAIPYDLYVPGRDGSFCNALTVWEAKSKSSFDMAAFSRGEYVKALEDSTKAEVISKVLYPADNHIEGKKLRLRQQYLLVSASLQSILRIFLRQHDNLNLLPTYIAIHLNDTHPALAIPELMRLLLDEHHFSWEVAWDLTCRTISYTNHTVMSEAMERWDLAIFRPLLPRITQIVEEIDRRVRAENLTFYGDDHAKLEYMAVISGGEVKMVNLCLCASHAINGVSALHTDILKRTFFRDYAVMHPERFHNITNGIAYRRWLCQSNPALCNLLDRVIGTAYRSDASRLIELLSHRDNPEILDELSRIKLGNKQLLCETIRKRADRRIDPNALMDVQVKRLHEYKRQLLNVFGILDRYLAIKDNPNKDFYPTTFVFAAKASSGYHMAKQILRLIVTTAALVDSDPLVRERLRVVFLEDYNVSLAQQIIPAAEISEQISLAGKEASGTGNMKMMMNGAVTLGTFDGANVEIFERVGMENGFLFGMNAEEVNNLKRSGYRPSEFVAASARLKRVVDLLRQGFCGSRFDEITASLLHSNVGTADPYLILADFDDYIRARERMERVYLDKSLFSRMSLTNIANSGYFSADRAIMEYKDLMWGKEGSL